MESPFSESKPYELNLQRETKSVTISSNYFEGKINRKEKECKLISGLDLVLVIFPLAKLSLVHGLRGEGGL
jgi:hypothetical protein